MYIIQTFDDLVTIFRHMLFKRLTSYAKWNLAVFSARQCDIDASRQNGANYMQRYRCETLFLLYTFEGTVCFICNKKILISKCQKDIITARSVSSTMQRASSAEITRRNPKVLCSIYKNKTLQEHMTLETDPAAILPF